LNIYLQGLFISLVGMSATFLALGAFIFIMIGLQKLFPWKPEPSAVSADQEEDAAPAMLSVSTPISDDKEVVAAIAIALEYFRSQSNLGSSLNDGRGNWWVSRRINSNQSYTHKK